MHKKEYIMVFPNIGFTLIELLIVIAIIAILATAVIISVNPGEQLAKARDVTRERHVKALETALYAYMIKTGTFPEEITSSIETEICNTNVESPVCGDLIDLSSLVPEYIPALPINLKTEEGSGTGYHVNVVGEKIAVWPEESETKQIGRKVALEFDGSGTIDGTVHGDNVFIPEDITKTDNYPQGVTYGVWLKVDISAVDRMSLFRGTGTMRHIEIYSELKKFRTEAAKQNGYSFGTSNFSGDVKSIWNHFVIVFANSEANRPVRWYQNGVLFHTGDLTSGDYPDTEYFSFGSIARSTGSVSYTYAKSFHGMIRDFRIYDYALSESEIKNLYNGQHTEEGLVGWWPISEGQGCTVYDHSGNENHGTLEPDCDSGEGPVWVVD